MISWKQIENYCDAIAREFQPEKIILFGSHAYGKPTPDSDVDLLVIMPHRKGTRPSLEIRRRIAAGFPVDILVRAPGEIAKQSDWGDSFTTEVLTKGRVMYETGHA